VAKGCRGIPWQFNYSLKENKMKKLIALFAVTTMASTAAVAGIALSGSASVSYDDNGSSPSATTYDADMTITGTAGATTLTASYDMEGASLATTAADLATTVGPITVKADMFDETYTTADDGDGDKKTDGTDTSVTVSLSAPVGDATIALDDSGDVTISGTWSGVTVSHTIQDGADKTVGSASIAGMDISLTNDAGSSTWSIGTTVSGVALTLDSENDVTATFGLSGNTMTVTHVGARAVVTSTATKHSKASAAAYTTVAVSRSLTSGATLTATYDDSNDSLTLKAAVSF
jgi:hypothetical protein